MKKTKSLICLRYIVFVPIKNMMGNVPRMKIATMVRDRNRGRVKILQPFDIGFSAIGAFFHVCVHPLYGFFTEGSTYYPPLIKFLCQSTYNCHDYYRPNKNVIGRDNRLRQASSE